MEMVNGYVFLDLTKSNVYGRALKVLGADKPVVIKDGSGSPYFVDSMALDGTNVVITKGGKTITIANDNTITNVGDIQNHLYKMKLYIKCLDENQDVAIKGYIYFLANENLTFDEKTSLTNDEIAYLNKYATDILVYDIDRNDATIFSVYDFKTNNCDNLSAGGDNTFNYDTIGLEFVNQLF